MKKTFDVQKIQDKTEGIDEQFKDLLDCLRVMPKDTPEERGERFLWVKSKPEYDKFVIEVMEEWDEGSFGKLKNRLQKEKYVSCSLDMDSGIATTERNGKRKEMDPVVFMETIKQAIESYTGVNLEGHPYTFIESVRQIYKHKLLREAGKNDFQKYGVVTGSKSERLYKVLKLAREADRLMQQLKKKYGNIDIKKDDIIEKCVLADEKFRYTKEEVKLAKKLVEGLKIISINTPTSESEDNTTTQEDVIKSLCDDFEEIEKQDMLDCLFKAMQNDFDEKWKMVITAAGKQDQEVIRAFLAKDILVILKLEPVNETERKIYKNLLEPKCDSWCSVKNKCPYAKYKDGKREPSRESCYIRYGDKDTSFIERGNRDIYQMLEEIGNSFYKTILDNAYVKNAYVNDVENYYDLFAEKLKPAKGTAETETFQFTDAVLGKAFGKNKSSVSKYRNTYETNVRPTLYELFREQLE